MMMNSINLICRDCMRNCKQSDKLIISKCDLKVTIKNYKQMIGEEYAAANGKGTKRER